MSTIWATKYWSSVEWRDGDAAAVPRSMREGSYACGASKWQTIRRIVLPRAMPGILTGAILAMARGAGEVAPLMLVGVLKIAPELPVDAHLPFVHPDRSFMHLGFHIFDLGFQSQNSEAARPMTKSPIVCGRRTSRWFSQPNRAESVSSSAARSKSEIKVAFGGMDWRR